jgi:NADP-dependent 3-hydroxy acid dehydrogenase YdfG
VVELDITKTSAPEKILQTALDAFGKIDVLVSNAGIWTDNELEKQNPTRVQEAFQVNSIASIRLMQVVTEQMTKQNSGHILAVISSAGASDSTSANNEDWMAYGATKWAVTGFMKSLAKKLSDTPIRTTAFMPGGFESDIYENAGRAGDDSGMHNQPWMMKTEDVADAAIFCLTRPADVQIESMLVTKKVL